MFIAGAFTNIGGLPLNNLARLNADNGQASANWNPGFSGTVAALAADDQWLYVAGSFTNISSMAITNLARLNISSGEADSTWKPIVQGEVTILAISNSWLYIGGAFSNVNQVGLTNLARIRTDTGVVDPLWHPAPTHSLQSADIAELKIYGDEIYVAGAFTSVGGLAITNVTRLDSVTGAADPAWIIRPNSDVAALAVNDTDVYLGGEFFIIGSTARVSLARVDRATGDLDPTWNPQANADGQVSAICLDGTNIYASGEFFKIGAEDAFSIARLTPVTGAKDTGFQASTLNQELGSVVCMAAQPDGKIVVGGEFLRVNNIRRNNIARFNSDGSLDAA
ncbi:MAG: delta-60 repeat domain-containing protein, partial [Kiritimatiellota bacterium]|nr:delta-60 repeat domain-containing protein [Kiritimatiellota bacterium]